MPRKVVTKKRKTRKMRGAGLWDNIKQKAKKINEFLKESKLISGTSKILSPYVPGASFVHDLSSRYGYGRRGMGRTKLERGMLP